MMPKNKHELAQMIAKRDGISYEEAMESVENCAEEINEACMAGDLDMAEDALHYWLGLEPDYLEIFLI